MKAIALKLIPALAILCLSTGAFAATSIEVKATGMTCEACVSKLNKEVAKIDLKKYGPVTLNVAVNKVTVDYSKATNLTDAQKTELKAAVETAVKAAEFELAVDEAPKASAKPSKKS